MYSAVPFGWGCTGVWELYNNDGETLQGEREPWMSELGWKEDLKKTITHWKSKGCGQNCGCCRAAMGEWFGVCEACDDAYTLATVNRRWKRLVGQFDGTKFHSCCE